MFKEFSILAINKTIVYYDTTTFCLTVMSQEPTEKEISTALEKLTTTSDLEKNREENEIFSSFKPKILCAIDRIKEKKKRPDIDSINDHPSRTKTSNNDKVTIELTLNELVKENVSVNKKTSLGESLHRINTPENLVNSLHSDSFSNNELKITESINSEESTADNNTPSTHADNQTPLTTNDNLSSLAKHSDKTFMNMEAKFSALKEYI